MELRAKRVIEAFCNCVRNGVYSFDYAVTLIEDNEKFGFLTEEDKGDFYDAFEVIEEDETAAEDMAGYEG